MIIDTQNYHGKQKDARIREMTYEELYLLISELDEDNEGQEVVMMKDARRIEGLQERIMDLVHELKAHDPNWTPWWPIIENPCLCTLCFSELDRHIWRGFHLRPPVQPCGGGGA